MISYCLIVAGILFSLFFWFHLITCRKKNKRIEFLNKEMEECVSNNKSISLQYESVLETTKSLQIMARLVKQSPNAIMIMDKDGNVLSVNNGFTNMYEYTYGEFIAARGSNYRKTSFSNQVLERIDRISKTKNPVKYEALNITKTSKKLWTQTALMPLLDEQGNFDGMATIDTDIHHRIVTSDHLIEKMEIINLKIDTMSKQFNLLVSETNSLFESINQLQALIQQTDQIVKIIKEISDTTKILGINASIEASIAGTYGRGFRTIANEIVVISNKTIQSVSEISKLLSSVNNNQEQLVKEKQVSEDAITEYQYMIKVLKNEIHEVENTINELKTLA